MKGVELISPKSTAKIKLIQLHLEKSWVQIARPQSQEKLNRHHLQKNQMVAMLAELLPHLSILHSNQLNEGKPDKIFEDFQFLPLHFNYLPLGVLGFWGFGVSDRTVSRGKVFPLIFL